MDTVIQFTPSQLVTMILAVCGGIVSVSAAVTVIAKIIAKAKQPEKIQNDRISKCEQRLDDNDKKFEKYDGFFKNDDARLKAIEESNKIILNALLALMKHAINGNDIDNLKQSQKELEAYLVKK